MLNKKLIMDGLIFYYLYNSLSIQLLLIPYRTTNICFAVVSSLFGGQFTVVGFVVASFLGGHSFNSSLSQINKQNHELVYGPEFVFSFNLQSIFNVLYILNMNSSTKCVVSLSLYQIL